MPRETDYKIMWSPVPGGYKIVHTPSSAMLALLTDTSTLQHWLRMIDTCSFCSVTGHTLTLQKERKQRGSTYWYAYKRVNGKLHKKYLGITGKLDIPTLEGLACQLAEPEPVAGHTKAKAKQQPPQQEPPRQPTLTFTRTLTSALTIYGFRSIPTRKELTVRYRELSKKHHPDIGGLHQDMVAVNLAYDYLKKFVDDRGW
jgi:hypothetical protein